MRSIELIFRDLHFFPGLQDKDFSRYLVSLVNCVITIRSSTRMSKFIILFDSVYFEDNMSNKINGVNTEVLNSAFNMMKNQPEMAKATFSVKSEWNGSFAVTSRCKDFRMGGQTIQRICEHKMVYDFPEQLSGEGQGATVCENCMGSLAACLTQTIVAHALRD